MAKKKSLRGGDLMLFVGTECWPLATQCNINASLSMLDPQTKDDGIYQTPDPDSKQWTAQCNNQSDDAFDTFAKVLALAKNHTKIDIKVGKPANANPNGVGNDGWSLPTDSLSGKAYISSVSFDAPVDGKATLSVSFAGAGKLN